jgi:hypothetical protein
MILLSSSRTSSGQNIKVRKSTQEEEVSWNSSRVSSRNIQHRPSIIMVARPCFFGRYFPKVFVFQKNALHVFTQKLDDGICCSTISPLTENGKGRLELEQWPATTRQWY